MSCKNVRFQAVSSLDGVSPSHTVPACLLLPQGILRTPRTPRTPTMEYISEGEEDDQSRGYSQSLTEGDEEDEDDSVSTGSFQCKLTAISG